MKVRRQIDPTLKTGKCIQIKLIFYSIGTSP